MPIRTLSHKRVETKLVASSDRDEMIRECRGDGWTMKWENPPSKHHTPPNQWLSEWTREIPEEPKGFTVTAFWPDGGESGHDTYCGHSNAPTWQQAVLDVVEEMAEDGDFEEATEISFDDVVPGHHVTADGADRYAVVVWKGGKAQWKEEEP